MGNLYNWESLKRGIFKSRNLENGESLKWRISKTRPSPSRNSHRCIHSRLGHLSGLRLSFICSNRPMPSPHSESAGVTHGICSTSLASVALVSTTIRPVHRLPSPPTSSGRSTDPGKQNPPSQTPTASWVASVSRGYQTAGIREFKKIATAGAATATGSKTIKKRVIVHVSCSHPAVANLDPELFCACRGERSRALGNPRARLSLIGFSKK